MEKEESRIHYDYIKQVAEIPRLWYINLFKRKKLNKKPKKILIVNTCLIGDIVASLPSIVKFIEKRKGCEIDLIVSSQAKSILEKVKGVRKVYASRSVSTRNVEGSGLSQDNIEEIKKENYDLVIVMRLSKDSYKTIKKIDSSFKVHSGRYLGYILHLLKIILFRGNTKQYRDFNFELLDEEIKNMPFNKIFNFTKEDYKKVSEMPLMQGNEKKIIIHAGNGWRKNWENEKWAELITKINKLGKFKFIFVGGGEEIKNFEEIKSKINFEIYSVIGKVNLAELLLMMRKSNYFIGVDSGPRNMAHLANLRSVSLLGPGPRPIHFLPTSKKDQIVDGCYCRCTQMFCYRKDKCMPRINVHQVLDAFKKLKNIEEHEKNI